MSREIDWAMRPIHKRQGIKDGREGRNPKTVYDLASDDLREPYEEGYRIGMALRQQDTMDHFAGVRSKTEAPAPRATDGRSKLKKAAKVGLIGAGLFLAAGAVMAGSDKSKK